MDAYVKYFRGVFGENVQGLYLETNQRTVKFVKRIDYLWLPEDKPIEKAIFLSYFRFLDATVASPVKSISVLVLSSTRRPEKQE